MSFSNNHLEIYVSAGRRMELLKKCGWQSQSHEEQSRIAKLHLSGLKVSRGDLKLM